MAIGKAFGLPRSSTSRRDLDDMDLSKARTNNCFFLFGTDPQFPPEGFDESYIVFLEAVYMAAAGTFTISDANGVISGAIPAPFVQDHSPLRMDGGVLLTGAITAAKGFFVKV